MRRSFFFLALGLIAASAQPAAAQSSSSLPDSARARVDRLFAGFTSETPGCGVGIGRDGKPVYVRGYGMANLEYGVPNSEQTVWESGSVAKQFTAGAMVLLALDGKLSLEDDIRKYLPEVPAFDGGPITIRMLLNHTSGLRDQWGLLGIMGRGPGQEIHSPATTVDLVAHQKMLNFPPGTAYLYSNTGYALAGVIVERVSGKSLDAFTQERLFKPLGMTSTQWRDDFNEIVKNRATAYRGGIGGLRTNMPFTNMIGNGGLLFTVGDMLKWLENLDNPTVGGTAWRDSLQVRGRLKNGKTITYALGLTHATYNGVREITHGGSTAGYQTWVGRYPDQHLAIAVLCNVTTANPGALAHQVANLFLPRAEVVAAQQNSLTPVTLSPAQSSLWRGVFRDPQTDQVIRFSVRDGSVAFGDPPTLNLVATAPTAVRGPTVEYRLLASRPNNRRVMVIRGEDSTTFVEVAPADTGVKTLTDYVGTYVSDELDVKIAIEQRGGALVARRRPNDSGMMVPAYKDGFISPALGGSVRFQRDGAGKVSGFAIFAGRVLDVRFRKISSDPKL